MPRPFIAEHMTADLYVLHNNQAWPVRSRPEKSPPGPVQARKITAGAGPGDIRPSRAMAPRPGHRRPTRRPSRLRTLVFRGLRYRGNQKDNPPCLSPVPKPNEYMAVTDASKEAIWLRALLTEISEKPNPRNEKSDPKCSKPQLIQIDNNGPLELSKNARYHDRTRHIDIKHHFIREAVERGDILLDQRKTRQIS